MKTERAKQIFESKDTFQVKLDGNPVWIESVDAVNHMATVQVSTNPGDTKTVSVEQLRED